MSLPFAAEKQFAISAVRRACTLTSSNETLTKGDKSPVTVGDFSAQALINIMLHHAFPADLIVGEEDAADLRAETGLGLRNRIVELANEALTGELGQGDYAEWGIGPGSEQTAEQLMDAIDRGNYQGGRSGRMWTIDPIDGTKGFLRGEQYAVCLAFLVDAKVQVGVLGCPNLPIDMSKPDGEKGCLFVAVRGQGAQQIKLSGADPIPLSMPPYSPSTFNFLESVEAAHASLSTNDKISSLMGITRPPIRMDSQAKYACLARGDGGAYMRMPTGVGYREKIWDHAAGSLIVEESGGIVSNSRGEPLDFGLGRTLGENYGVIATVKDAHARLLEVVQQVTAADVSVHSKA
ncbi:3(2),5-bisphosphate nucleotidase HAL2 [Gymnopus androsaceus JB14]|uniref:3'(2'),5'-bisphosphate nucleotidase n=1 Tax=Gymnopus androsaceus JB14 TaxID=1447944 RepID=A0A6A4ICI9_9AGAR|nr:3(2),5-bisphosphate nucleotidase HAL2 [Gymnopus androsaceus JB14]